MGGGQLSGVIYGRFCKVAQCTHRSDSAPPPLPSEVQFGPRAGPRSSFVKLVVGGLLGK